MRAERPMQKKLQGTSKDPSDRAAAKGPEKAIAKSKSERGGDQKH